VSLLATYAVAVVEASADLSILAAVVLNNCTDSTAKTKSP
jgi:hypothetical protein